MVSTMDYFVVGVCGAAGGAVVVGVWAWLVMRGMDVDADERADVLKKTIIDMQHRLELAQEAVDDRNDRWQNSQLAATQWAEQARVLAAQNERLLDELAAARLDAGQSARDILAAFTAPPPTDTPPPPDGFGPTGAMADVDAALLAATGEPDWTDSMGWIGVAQDPARPPDFTSDIPAAEDHT